MGGRWSCCGDATSERRLRQELLREGNVFTRRASSFLGLLPTSEKVHVALTASYTLLELKSAEASALRLGGKKDSAVSLAAVAVVHAGGATGLVLFAADGSKLLELEAAQPEIRDLWVQTLRELVDHREPPESTLHDELEKQKLQDKERYWAARTAELHARKAAADSKKAAFANVGLKYTAQAMLQR
ncbi:hypothetical protein ACHHYP_09449 [Achlya hypogyna]|uniref:PH domain-containing protein n=1 Tax=Achlya hypogyna TaxID=1202772 RepID=A0A1V9ZIY1_ACHHY|nr:hypothetical protein ACHHYP_09449 [Achlya hypogyna]